jgi:hypothetical protein
MKDKSKIISQMKLWKSLTNSMDELQSIDKKYKNSSQIKIDALLLNQTTTTKIEEANIAEDDIIVVEVQVSGKSYTLVPLTNVQEEEEDKMSEQTMSPSHSSNITLQDIISRDLNTVLTPNSRRGITGL